METSTIDQHLRVPGTNEPKPVNGSNRDPLCAPAVWQQPAAQLRAALQSSWYRLISHLLADIVDATADFYRELGYRPALMPVTCGSVSSPMGRGSDSDPVEIDLFGENTFLADSLQFHLEFLLRHDYRGVYYIMPSFRGEKPDATHLNQFFHSEVELCGDFEEVMRVAESYVRHLAARLLESDRVDDLERAAGTLQHVEAMANSRNLPRIKFDDAFELVKRGENCVAELEDGTPVIRRAGELELIREHGHAVWLTHLPAMSVPFYQANADDRSALAADLLFGPGEVVGCGERHRHGPAVRRALASHGVDPRPYHWYVEMKEHFPLQTAGFGLGIERFLMWAMAHDDARDVQIFPRVKGSPSWI